jgi:AraC-like DNA-binding protein
MYALSFKLAAANWPSNTTSRKYEKSSLSVGQLNDYRNQLISLMRDEKPYLNNGLKLSDLSDALNIPIHHLSRVVNESFGKSFFDYVNEKRVLEAKSLIESGENITLLEIAFKVGFNNKNSFTNAFKKNIGVTPSAYKQEFHHSKN